jgi:ubiquinone/menaquinone biosynthesis C-methylase UbiE
MSPTTEHAAEISLSPTSEFQEELARIRAVYDRRGREVSPDRYADTNPRAAIFQQELEQRILQLLATKSSLSLATQRVLDVGCGDGRWLRRFTQWGASPENLAGIDLLPERIAVARQSSPSAVRFYCGSAGQIPLEHRSVDIVLCMNVFSSILAEGLRAAVATEMLRVLRRGGFVVWYDFFVNNPANSDVRGVGKAELARLFAGCEIELSRITVAAPLGRAIAPLPLLYSVLAKCRIFSTHFLGWICKP